MQDNNLLKFLLFSAIFTLGYMLFLSQFQEPAPQQKQQVNQPEEQVAEAKGEEQAQTELDQVKSDEPDLATETEKPAQPETEIGENKFEENPHEILSLGTDDENSESGYYIQVNLSTAGAVVESVFMNDQRYKDLDDTEQSLQLLGNNLTKDRSFALSVEKIDDQLKEFGKTLHNVDWKVVKRGEDDAGLLNEVVFQFTSPDQKIRVEKRYALGHAEGENVNSGDARDTQNAGYLLDLTFKVYNLDDKPKLLQYTALGPAGVILENEKYATKFRDLKYKFEPEEGVAEESYIYAKTIADAGENQDSWTNPFDYLSVDVQYFTTVLMPQDERPFKQRMEKPWIAKSTPYILSVNAKDKNKSDISFMLTSRNMELDAGASESHHFTVYLGPKRADLLEPLGASGVLEFWGWIAWLSKLLVGFLHLMNRSLGMPYWLAIISLTIIVRGCMHPLTRKQAASAKRMKELQPQLMELKKKYGNDREKMGQAQMQLFRDNNYNPFAGCLPLFLQMPIFIALYQGLRSSIDLRLAPFLWIENLAEDASTRSNTSVCLKFTDARIQDGASFAKAVAKRLEAENVALDIGAYRDAPAGLRIWCGGTVETSDIEAMLPWLAWAFEAEIAAQTEAA